MAKKDQDSPSHKKKTIGPAKAAEPLMKCEQIKDLPRNQDIYCGPL